MKVEQHTWVGPPPLVSEQFALCVLCTVQYKGIPSAIRLSALGFYQLYSSDLLSCSSFMRTFIILSSVLFWTASTWLLCLSKRPLVGGKLNDTDVLRECFFYLSEEDMQGAEGTPIMFQNTGTWGINRAVCTGIQGQPHLCSYALVQQFDWVCKYAHFVSSYTCF